MRIAAFAATAALLATSGAAQPCATFVSRPASAQTASAACQSCATKTGAEIIGLFQQLHRELGQTVIYVTHDQIEAMTMATRIAVINKGVLQQLDTPQKLYDLPNNMFVASFIGSPAMNFFPATLKKGDGKLFVDTGTFSIPIPAEKAAPYQAYVDKKIVFGIRPEDIHNPLYLPPSIHAETVPTKVDVTELMGNEIFLYLVSGPNNYVARVDPRTTFKMGDQLEVAFKKGTGHAPDDRL